MNDATSTINPLLSLAVGAAPILLGAVLAVLGGWIGFEIQANREDGRELKAIKIMLGDELASIDTTIQTMHETWTQSSVLYPSYISDLSSNTTCFDELKLRLFLINDDKLRGEIRTFYKKFKDLLRKSEGKVGTLAETQEAKDEQKKLHDEFEKLGKEAGEIKNKLTPSAKNTF